MKLLPLSLLAALALAPLHADDAAKVDARYPFRTDFANAHLPWYQPRPLEFPPHHSDRRIGGALVSVDFVHRTGRFRTTQTGELVEFALPPYGAISFLNAEADLRDVPLGTFFLFFLHQDANGEFTRLATMQDQFTMDASHGFTYRLDEARLGEGRLLTTKQSLAKNQPDLGKKELLVTPATRVWKGDAPARLSDLAAGDELLFNLAAKTATSPGVCTDLWIGKDTHERATKQQREKFEAFVKHRGLPGWVEKTEENRVTITFFSGDARAFQQRWKDDLVVGKGGSLAVANDELRTWNPPVDKEGASILEVGSVPTDGYGCSGVRVVVRVSNLLEGFRRGRIVRFFASGWPAKDQFYGESLMGYGYGRLQTDEVRENVAREYPEQFPFRTDFGNAQLPWFQLKTGEVPPPFSEHVVHGELVKVDAEKRTGVFRADRTGARVEFALTDPATVRFLNATASLTDLPAGTRCRFHLYQDASGAFTRAQLVSDEFSYLASQSLSLRVEALDLTHGRLIVLRQMPDVKNYNGDLEQPPPIGRAELLVTPQTRVWRGEQSAKLSDLAVGDLLLVNGTGELPGQPSTCTDLWIGTDTHKLVAELQAKKSPPVKK